MNPENPHINYIFKKKVLLAEIQYNYQCNIRSDQIATEALKFSKLQIVWSSIAGEKEKERNTLRHLQTTIALAKVSVKQTS